MKKLEWFEEDNRTASENTMELWQVWDIIVYQSKLWVSSIDCCGIIFENKAPLVSVWNEVLEYWYIVWKISDLKRWWDVYTHWLSYNKVISIISNNIILT